METIKDILSEMLEFADTDAQTIGRDVLRRRIQHFADRIEKAVKALESDRDNWRNQALAEDERANTTQLVTNCNGFKLREALEQINRIVWDKHRHTKEETEAHRLATEALTEPPRNCDLYKTENETLKAFHATHPISTYYLYVKWLFAEAKGDAK